jgi:hypothetical protein
MYVTRKQLLLIILALVGFVSGRFWVEIQCFLNTPYSIIGGLMAILIIQQFYIIHLKK